MQADTPAIQPATQGAFVAADNQQAYLQIDMLTPRGPCTEVGLFRHSVYLSYVFAVLTPTWRCIYSQKIDLREIALPLWDPQGNWDESAVRRHLAAISPLIAQLPR